MFTVIKRMEISASHKLVLPYRSKCASLHGHNWIITVYCRSARLNSEGMVVDFTRIKEVVTEKLDHQNLNEVLPFNPTAENIARWVCKQCRNRKETLSSTRKIPAAQKDKNSKLNKF